MSCPFPSLGLAVRAAFFFTTPHVNRLALPYARQASPSVGRSQIVLRNAPGSDCFFVSFYIKYAIIYYCAIFQSLYNIIWNLGFLGSSAGKESACNAWEPGSIPGSGRSTGEGTGHPLQYSWASLVAQMAKNLPAWWETWVWSLGWEDPLEKGTATHSSILARRIPQAA